MFKRIRYITAGDNKLKSSKVYEVNGQSLSVSLNLADMSFLVIDEVSGGAQAAGSGAVNQAQLKMMAKEAMVSLGVPFEEEKRKTKEAIEV